MNYDERILLETGYEAGFRRAIELSQYSLGGYPLNESRLESVLVECLEEYREELENDLI